SLVHEVGIYFDGQLYRGNRAFKYNSAKFEAFRSPNYPVLVEAGVHVRYNESALQDNSDKEFIVHTKLDNSISVLKSYLGYKDKVVRNVHESDARSVIMEAVGSVNATTDTSFLHLLSSVITSGKNKLKFSQCRGGSVELGRYETS